MEYALVHKRGVKPVGSTPGVQGARGSVSPGDSTKKTKSKGSLYSQDESGLSQLRSVSMEVNEELLHRPVTASRPLPPTIDNPSAFNLALWRFFQGRHEATRNRQAAIATLNPNSSLSEPASITHGGFLDKMGMVERDVDELHTFSLAVVRTLLSPHDQRLLLQGYPEFRTRNRGFTLIKVVTSFLDASDRDPPPNYMRRIGEVELEIGHYHSSFITDAAELALYELWDLVHISIPQLKKVIRKVEERRLEFEYADRRVRAARNESQMDVWEPRHHNRLEVYHNAMKDLHTAQNEFEVREEKTRRVFQRLLHLEAKYHHECAKALARLIDEVKNDMDLAAVGGLTFINTLTGLINHPHRSSNNDSQ